MSFNGMLVWRVRVWLFAIAVLLVASHRPFAAQPVQLAQAACPAVTSKAVRRFFTRVPHAPGATACGLPRHQRPTLSRVPI